MNQTYERNKRHGLIRGRAGEVEGGRGIRVDLRRSRGSLFRVFAIYSDLTNLGYVLGNPLTWVILVFQVWMFIDAIRRQEWIWAACIFFFSILSAVFYFFMVYRQAGPAGGSGLRGFELPGAGERRRIKELEGRIHHLDKARDHLDLADIYFSQGKLAKAEASYRASLERDPSDVDAVAHLGVRVESQPFTPMALHGLIHAAARSEAPAHAAEGGSRS